MAHRPLRRAVGNTRCDHPAVAVPDENQVAQPLAGDHREHVADRGLEVHERVDQVRALAEAGVGRREHLVAPCAEGGADLPPRPAAGPRAVADEKLRHGSSPAAARGRGKVWAPRLRLRKAGRIAAA